MKIIDVRADGQADAELEGSICAVDVSLVSDPMPGDFVIVHAGFAIEKLDIDEANARLRLFEELARVQGAESGAGSVS